MGCCNAIDDFVQRTKGFVDFNERVDNNYPLFKNDCFQKYGYIPFVSIVTGFGRVAKHVATLFADTILILLESINNCIRSLYNKKLRIVGQILFFRMPIHLYTTTISNTLNIARGIIEMVPLIGNGICIGFDTVVGY